MTAQDIQYLCQEILGEDWYDYFYPEFVDAITPGEEAYYVMAELKSKGWTDKELANHSVYGYWINLALPHPRFHILHKFFENNESGCQCKGKWKKCPFRGVCIDFDQLEGDSHPIVTTISLTRHKNGRVSFTHTENNCPH